MKDELIILVEKFLRKSANTEDMARLKKLFLQADAKNILHEWYDKEYEQASSQPEKEVEERIWNRIRKEIYVEPKIRPLWQRALRIAASILVPLVCAGLGYYFSTGKTARNENPMLVRVEIGQKANMQLPDGTQVWLNSAGSLSYDSDYNSRNRVVYLQGEAYFEVRKDKSRPFIVKMNDLSVEALGTSFNVKAYPDDDYITATLIEGSIRVSSPAGSDILVPNEKITFVKNTGRFTKSRLLDADKNTSWVNNQLAFEQERLEDIAKVLERMYNIRIYFASDELKNIRFSGTIKNNNLETVLQSITFVSPIRYDFDNDSIVNINNP
ncbi:MAG: DUF4974 domain-containing protein [Dysgonamonadaceae bacterium]|jgi:ferric-dicitrate binding protein FerR (iron transport regulator)|nr:DUF4974 domain-containing protein [Dysgonamonadaceae bacterium]